MINRPDMIGQLWTGTLNIKNKSKVIRVTCPYKSDPYAVNKGVFVCVDALCPSRNFSLMSGLVSLV